MPGPTGDERDAIMLAIADTEKVIARVAEEQAERERQLSELRTRLAQWNEPIPRSAALAASHTMRPDSKVELFLSLFRGRTDVYPTRFVRKRDGQAGYAPDCRNKFVKGVCDLPKVKCGECANQAFRPFDAAAVREHLLGKHVMGVYPLLENDSCWFLAADFDEGTWRDDVSAFVATARRAGLPLAIERSRSGKGAHVWFFFSSPVTAASARKMGCHLLTETMANRHELSMRSYDRLFPSQDTMPRGGFGNLIALPLQAGPRKEGNSIFLDDGLAPIADALQWAHLATIGRIAPDTVERIAAEATRQGTVLGVRAAEVSDEDASPWTRSPTGRARFQPITEPIPERIEVVLAQKLFVPKAGLPSSLLNQIKRLAAFQNPEFYKKQSMRLSTAMTPRVISCAEELPLHVGIPRGCQFKLGQLLASHGARMALVDERITGAPLDVRFTGELTSVQQTAARAMVAHDIGVFVAPPGVGKTVLGTHLIAARGCNTLVLVHRRPLLDQWLAQLAVFLGLDPKEIGQIGAGKRKPNGRLDVAMIQSLVHHDAVDELVGQYGHVIVDECHHLPAVSFERVLAQVKARYVVGLTATPLRRDGHHPITQMQLGPVRYAVDAKAHANKRPFEHRLVVRETGFVTESAEADAGIQSLYAALARDEARNQMILDDVIGALRRGRSPILLTERKDHLQFFANALKPIARHVIVLQGGMGAREHREVRERLAAVPDLEERILIATGRYIGEGFDDARLDTLFLAMPVSWKGTLVQYTGRLHRLHPGKTEVQLYDYVDREVPMLLRMFERRLRGYRAIGYARGEAPLGFAEPREDLVIEYDEETISKLETVDEFT
jgi:superfamily II DNA or RNA helicase